MRTIILSLFLALISNSLISQTTFNKLEDLGSIGITATNVKRIGSNYFIQYIYLDSAWKQGVGILKTDKYGSILKDIKYIDTLYLNYTSAFTNLIVSSDSFLIAAVNRSYNYQTNTGDAIVWKYNTNLDTIWTKIIQHPDTLEASQSGAEAFLKIENIVESLDGGIAISVFYNRNCQDPTDEFNYRNLLLKIDSNGNNIWVNRLNDAYIHLHNIKSASDTGYFITNVESLALPFKLIKLDRYGNNLWSVTANNHPTQGTPTACCIYDSSSVLLATCFKLNSEPGEVGISVSMINTDSKSVQWNKDFILAENMASAAYLRKALIDIQIDKNGGIYIIGSGISKASGYAQRGIVLKINSSGDSLWTKLYTYGHPANYSIDAELNGFLINDDGSFFGVGYTLSPQQKLWYFKTDATGYLGLEENEVIKESGISVFPNPAVDYVNIEFDEIPIGNSKIQIFDITGRLIGSKEIDNQSNITFNLSDLKEGVYILNIKSYEGWTKSVKIIKN
jgi:hypothetical protein